jgi:hypothetical protein
MKIIDRKRAPVLQEESSAQLPTREERAAILARARGRAAVANNTAVVPVSAQRRQPITSQPDRSRSVQLRRQISLRS